MGITSSNDSQGVPMPLTDTHIRSLKPDVKPRKYFDGGGLFLFVPANGSKLWRMAYRFDGKSKLFSFGEYPTVSLKDARERREEAKRMLSRGITRQTTSGSYGRPQPSRDATASKISPESGNAGSCDISSVTMSRLLFELAVMRPLPGFSKTGHRRQCVCLIQRPFFPGPYPHCRRTGKDRVTAGGTSRSPEFASADKNQAGMQPLYCQISSHSPTLPRCCSSM